jgi:hypothetical protein
MDLQADEPIRRRKDQTSVTRRTLWILVFAYIPLRAFAAGPHSVALVLEPTYTACISGNPACSSTGRVSAAAQYKPVVTKKVNLRIKLSRAYVHSPDEAAIDDIDVASNQSYHAAADSLDVRLQFFDDNGYERQEPRAGYTYQHPVGASSAYHSSYVSDSWFFGDRIRRGTQAPARRFRLVVKLSQNTYQAAGDLPQTFLQVAPYAMFPLDPSGFWRVETGYTIQRQFAGAGRLAPYSTRVSASLTHDFTTAVEAYLRAESTLSTGSRVSPPANARSATVVFGAKVTF